MTETPNPHIVDADTLTGEMRPIRRVVLALGSNLGERMAKLQGAVNAIADTPDVWVTGVSPVYETEPVDCPRGLGDLPQRRAAHGHHPGRAPADRPGPGRRGRVRPRAQRGIATTRAPSTSTWSWSATAAATTRPAAAAPPRRRARLRAQALVRPRARRRAARRRPGRRPAGRGGDATGSPCARTSRSRSSEPVRGRPRPAARRRRPGRPAGSARPLSTVWLGSAPVVTWVRPVLLVVVARSSASPRGGPARVRCAVSGWSRTARSTAWPWAAPRVRRRAGRGGVRRLRAVVAGSSAELASQRMLLVGAAALAGVGVVACGLLLERACRVPDDAEDA